MKKVINVSESNAWKDYYQKMGEQIAEKFPDFQVIVDGGSFRCYDVRLEVNLEERTIKVDYYLPLYLDSKLQTWIENEVRDYINYGYNKGFKSKEQANKVCDCLSGIMREGIFNDLRHLVYDESEGKMVLSFNYNTHKKYRETDLIGTVELYANGTVVKKTKSNAKRYNNIVKQLQKMLKEGEFNHVFCKDAA